MYLAYTIILFTILVPCMLALYVWRLYRGGDQDAPGEPPPPPHPETPDPVDSPVSRDFQSERPEEHTPQTVHA